MSRADRETRQLLFLFTNQSANTMDSTHDDEAMRDAAMCALIVGEPLSEAERRRRRMEPGPLTYAGSLFAVIE